MLDVLAILELLLYSRTTFDASPVKEENMLIWSDRCGIWIIFRLHGELVCPSVPLNAVIVLMGTNQCFLVLCQVFRSILVQLRFFHM